METYYKPDDLPKFPDIGQQAPSPFIPVLPGGLFCLFHVKEVMGHEC